MANCLRIIFELAAVNYFAGPQPLGSKLVEEKFSSQQLCVCARASVRMQCYLPHNQNHIHFAPHMDGDTEQKHI